MISPKVLRTRLAVIGHIKIGRKGPPVKNSRGGVSRFPQKLDHFEVTTNMRDKDEDFIVDQEIHKVIGEKPLELGIMLLYNDIDLTFRTCLAKYQGRRAVCRNSAGGETAQRWDPEKKIFYEVECPCPDLNTEDNPAGICKPHGKLSCILECSNVAGGVYVFDTTSWNSISSIQASLTFLRGATCGRIAGIPIKMVLNKKQTNVNGQNATIYFVNLTYTGNSKLMLETAVARTRELISAGMNLQEIEQEAKLLLSYDEADGPIDREDVPEFHPDAPPDPDAPPPPELKTQAQALADLGASIRAPKEIETTRAERPPVAEVQKPLRFFACAACGNVHTVREPIGICEGCGHTVLVEKVGLKDPVPARTEMEPPAQGTKQSPVETKTPIPETKPATTEVPAPTIGDLIRKEFTRLKFNGARKTLQIKVTLGRPWRPEDLDKLEAVDQTKILESLKKLK